MNAAQVLQWIKDNRPDWINSPHYAWLQWALQSSPDKQIVLDAVNRDIQSGETDISQVNTNAQYNINLNSQLAQQQKQAGSVAQVSTGVFTGPEAEANKTQATTSSPPPTGSWDSTQQMVDFINSGGNDQNFISNILGLSHPTWDKGLQNRPSIQSESLVNYVNGLPKNQQKLALNSIQQYLKDRSGWTPLRQVDIDDARAQAVRDVQSATKQSGSSSASGGPVVDKGSDILTGTIQQGTTDLNSDEVALWKRYTGQDFNQLVSSFNQQYAVAVQRVNSSGAPIGEPKLWTHGALNLAQGYVATVVPLSSLTDAEKKQYQGKNLKVTGAQFAAMQSQGTYSKIQATKAVEDQFVMKYGHQPSDPLKEQIYSQIENMDQFTFQQAVQGAGGATAWAQSAVGTGGLFYNLFTSQPEYQQQAVITNLEGALGTNWSQYVSQDQVAKLATMSTTDQTNYINNLPDPTHPGFTIGAWQSGYGQILNDWQTNFGFSSKPTDAQITALMGMNTTQRTDYFNNSPSPVSGMNNLTYKGYDSLVNNIRSDLTPSMGSDFLSSLASPSQAAANLKPGVNVPK